MKLRKRLFKTLLLSTMCFSLFSCVDNSGNTNAWLVNSGVPTQALGGQEGQMYLDTSTYDIYQYTNGDWLKVGNIKGENGTNGQDGQKGEDGINGQDGQKGEDGKTPKIEIINGYWYVDGVNTHVKAEGEISQTPTTPVKEKLTEEEFKSQTAKFGSFVSGMTESEWRLRIEIQIATERNTIVKFLGDTSVYSWAVVETYNLNDNTSGTYTDSGWHTTWSNYDGTYASKLNGGHLVLTLKRSDRKFTQDDLSAAHSLFSIDGYKYNKDYNNSSSSSGNGSYITSSTENVKAINHRGACFEAPENTLSAYRKSYENGFKYVETDVLFTKDNIPVLLHDDTIDRTSNGSGKIAELTYAQAAAFDYSYNSSNSELEAKYEAYRGEKLPKFEEFIVLCKKLNLHPYIEIKGTLSLAQAELLLDIVKRCSMLNSVTWISFSSNALYNIVSIYSKARVGLVLNTVIDQSKVDILNTVLRTGENEAFFDIWHTQDTEAAIDLCVANDIPLEVWYCDKVEEILNLHPYVSGVTSNCLIAQDVLKENA